jgi:hypothetical protein
MLFWAHPRRKFFAEFLPTLYESQNLGLNQTVTLFLMFPFDSVFQIFDAEYGFEYGFLGCITAAASFVFSGVDPIPRFLARPPSVVYIKLYSFFLN